MVFSTKQRVPCLEEGLRPDLYAYLAGICRHTGGEAYRVGGMADHVHLACALPRTLTVSRLLQELKSASSAWVKQQGSQYGQFAWQAGYGAFSIGQSQVPALVRYVDRQAKHHEVSTFQEEYVALLRKYQVTYDERQLWS